MHNPEFIMGIEMQKLLWDFDRPNLGQTTTPRDS